MIVCKARSEYYYHDYSRLNKYKFGSMVHNYDAAAICLRIQHIYILIWIRFLIMIKYRYLNILHALWISFFNSTKILR